MTTLNNRITLPLEEISSYLIDFEFPDDTCFGGLKKRLYKVDSRITCKQVVNLLCNKLKIKNGSERFMLSTEKGRLLDESRSLGAHGLGLLFLTWHLKLAQRPPESSFFIVDVVLPSDPKFSGQKRKTIKTPSTITIAEVKFFFFSFLFFRSSNQVIILAGRSFTL
jgi:hypothetical protein